MPIDDIVKKYNINDKDNPEIKSISEVTGKEHIFAIPLKDNKKLSELGVNSKDLYIAIRVHDQQSQKKDKKSAIYENAFKVLEEIIRKEN